MKKRLIASALAVIASASLTLAQAPVPEPSQPVTPPSGVLKDVSPGGGANSGTASRFWVKAEYLLWWIKGDSLPPLVTTGPASLAGPAPGAIGTPGTVVLFGGDRSDPGAFSGGRLTVGFWYNECQTKGIEASYFILGSRSNDFSASSSGAPGSIVLARPFLDTTTGLQNSELDAFPGLAAGTKIVHSSSQLQGGEANLVCNLCQSCNDCCDCCAPTRHYRVDWLTGFRYLNLKEDLRIEESSRGIGPLAGINPTAFDQFDTRNQFFGPQIGIRATVEWNRWFAELSGKVALGTTRQSIDISGFTTFNPPIAVAGRALGGPGDLLALPSNIGHYSRNVFTVVPEANINIGYQVTNNLQVFVGYSFLWWSDVVRPGDTIDLHVNSTRTPGSLLPPTGPLAPLLNFHGSDFWAQGINVGLQLRF